MLARLLVALVVGAAAGLQLISKHGQVDLVDAAGASGDGVASFADALYLGAALYREREAASFAGELRWWWCWLR
jgi:hypothetical protein